MNLKIKKQPLVQYLLLFVFMLIIMLFFRETGIDNEIFVKFIINCALIGVGAYYLIYKNKKEIDVVNLIIICGIILRIGYTIYTPMVVRSHDIGAIDVNGNGHYGYICRILTEGKLPDTNGGQFYHPPLFYTLSAILVRILSIFFKHDYAFMIEYAKLVSCFAGCMTIIALKKFAEELSIKHIGVFTAIISFFPNFILMSGRLNNDALAFFFISMCALYTYRWYSSRKVKDIIILALSFGFGMMSKLSIAPMALFTGVIMIIELYKGIKNKDSVVELIKQYAIFAVICIPLGLWYPIRNLILFGQSISYTPMALYLTDEMKSMRLGYFIRTDFWDTVINPYCNMSDPDCSVLNSILRTSMFGEFGYAGKDVAARILACVNIVAIGTSIFSAVYLIVKDKAIKSIVKYGLIGIWACTMLSYVWFIIKFPANCTMDFRYISITAVTGAAFMSILPETKKETQKFIDFITVLFCLFSFVMYAI